MAYDYLTHPLDLAAVRKNLADAVSKQRAAYGLVVAALDALRPFDGKRISKRMATAVKNAIPGSWVYLNDRSGMAFLNIAGPGMPTSDAVNLFLAYNSEYIYSVEAMEYGRGIPHDQIPPGKCVGRAYPWLRFETDLADYERVQSDIVRKVGRFNAARNLLREAIDAFDPLGYAIFKNR